MKWFLILTIILTIISIIFVYFDWDRKLKLKMSSLNTLSNIYSMKPKYKNGNRVVAVMQCDKINNNTIKTLLDQSIRLHDIAIETHHPEYIDDYYLDFVSIHKPGTVWLREGDRDTIVVDIENGREYAYDHIENEADRIKNVMD